MKRLLFLSACFAACLTLGGCGRGDSNSAADIDPADVEQYNSPADYDPNEGLGPGQ